MVHMSDLSWDEPGEAAMAKYEKGQVVKAKVLDVDAEKERISLGVKQLEADPAADVLDRCARATSSPASSPRCRPTASR
jgi:small subunit ribosomal protein S1